MIADKRKRTLRLARPRSRQTISAGENVASATINPLTAAHSRRELRLVVHSFFFTRDINIRFMGSIGRISEFKLGEFIFERKRPILLAMVNLREVSRNKC